jgi:hypothetical protein
MHIDSLCIQEGTYSPDLGYGIEAKGELSA